MSRQTGSTDFGQIWDRNVSEGTAVAEVGDDNACGGMDINAVLPKLKFSQVAIPQFSSREKFNADSI